jgi:hypothetical protein
MKTLPILISALAICSALRLEAEPETAFQGEVSPPAGKASERLFWIADSRKMDAFLATFRPQDLHVGAYKGEVLPDTRVAWRDYALEATTLARQGRNAEAGARLAQMLKLAAVYRSFGGLQNVVQGEEIRHLAGVTAEKLGNSVVIYIRSPYLEKDASDCLLSIEAHIGGERNQVTDSFWRNFEMGAVDTYYRLTGNKTSLAVNH